MIPVVTPEEMGAIDAAAPDPVEVLIDRAGSAVARVALQLLDGAYGRTVAVIAGPGNNGADGRLAADRLRARGVQVLVFDATDCPDDLPAVDLVIDAAFGTGFHGDWTPPTIESTHVLAVDVPTGLDALTGVSASGTLRADVTVTFAAAKPGQLLGAGPDLVGRLEVVDIGLAVDSSTIGVVEAGDVTGWLPRRSRTGHKWDSAVRVVAGSAGMTGSAALLSGAAQRAGAGMCVLSSPGIDADAPAEVVGRAVESEGWADEVLDDLQRFHSLVIGPGLGRSPGTSTDITDLVVAADIPVVIDGDGLSALTDVDDGLARLRHRTAPTVLTPHDGEFARLTGDSPGADRIDAAHRLVERSAAVVLLKGPTTVVASPDGTTLLVANGDERLSTAGTGDVLAGVVGALLARGAAPQSAAAGGAWIHAAAGRRRSRQGLVASDLVGAIPEVLESLDRSDAP